MLFFLRGALFALSLSLGVGPGLVVQFEASMNRGFAAGAMVISGLYMSDFILMMVGYWGINHLMVPDQYRIWMGGVSALIFMIFGTVILLKQRGANLPKHNQQVPPVSQSLIMYFIKGFLTNISNPFSLVFWMGIIGISGTSFGLFTRPFYLFFLGLLGTAISLDLFKCYIFSRTKKFFTPRQSIWMNRIMGVLLILIGFIVIHRVL